MKKTIFLLTLLVSFYSTKAQVTELTNGNIGIGTTNPIKKLDINGTFRAQNGSNQLLFENNKLTFQVNTSTGGWARQLRIGNHNGVQKYVAFGGLGNGTNNTISYAYIDASGTPTYNGLSQFRLYPNGNASLVSGSLGIGTTNPSAKLHVNGSILMKNSGWLSSQSSNGTTKRLLGIDAANDVYIGGVDTGMRHLNFRTNGLNRMKILDNGNIGIGTTNPNEKLQISEGNLKIHGHNTSRYLRFTESNLQGAFINYDGASNILNIGVNNTSSDDNSNDYNSISILRSDGNVGIGTTNTKGFKLGVNGKIAAEEVKVALYESWPDFVFENTYKLPTLNEVENHIKTKGHLKNIPSATEVDKNGFFLGEMDAKLLQKIEELTLYTIAQEKSIENLQKINNEQKIRFDKLEKLVNKLMKNEK